LIDFDEKKICYGIQCDNVLEKIKEQFCQIEFVFSNFF